MNPLAVRRLAARASHEVRGPLTVALLALDGMVARGELAVDAARGLQLQLDRARLGVEDLAAAAAGEAARDRLEVVPVAALLDHLALAWRHESVRVGPAPAGAAVLADRARLGQALGNLVANALEHGAPPVEVRARVLDARLRLEVRDAGPGLPAPLRTLTRRSRGRRGHGLSIAAEIAERHGGRLLAGPATVALELPARSLP
jgi:signal transduction histidine kinase